MRNGINIRSFLHLIIDFFLKGYYAAFIINLNKKLEKEIYNFPE